MTLHESTFEYLSPTPAQLETMAIARRCAAEYATAIERLLPDGPDKTYLLRKFREVAMWVNISITRQSDGSARITEILTPNEMRARLGLPSIGEEPRPPPSVPFKLS